MNRLIVRMKVGNIYKTLDLPADEEVGVLKEHILIAFSGKKVINKKILNNYYIETQGGKKIEDFQTLLDASVKDNDLLLIHRNLSNNPNRSQSSYVESFDILFNDAPEKSIGKPSSNKISNVSSVAEFDMLD